MEKNLKNIEEIRKQKIKDFKEECKRCLIRKIKNGYIVSLGTDISFRWGIGDEDEENLKKDIEEYFFNTLKEVLLFIDDYFSKGI